MKIGRRGFLVASAAGWATLKAKFLASRALPVVSSRETASNRLSGFKMVATGSWVRLGDAPQGYDSAFACGLQGWNIVNGGSPASYHFAVQPSGDFGVAIGFYDPITKPGKRVQNVVIDGDLVDTIDPAAEGRPVVRLYKASDLNGDGWLEVTCSHAHDEAGITGLMNIIWIFNAETFGKLDAGRLARGEDATPHIYRVDYRTESYPQRGHIDYPRLSDERLKKMLPLRPIQLDLGLNLPEPIDPLDLQIRGELADRVQTLLDRWGFVGRDQKLVAGFLSDSGFETASRYLDTVCLLSRLTKRNFELQVSFEALLARQDRNSQYPGAFVGGKGDARPAASWTQGIALGALMSFYEHSGGDPRATQAGERVVDWYDNLLQGKFSVGSWGGNGRYGALEPLVAFYWRTRNPKALALAKKIADLGRESGGIAWMIYGKEQEDHLHSCLNTVRGFPWLYAATGDRSYLEDAIAACDRVYEWCTWSNGMVAELVHPPEPHCFKTDETCPTADEVMLSYHLWDLTREGRFYDRAETIYYNGIRFQQWFTGNFNTYSDPYVGLKGPDNWWCCSWWGAKALFEVARNLYATSPQEGFINGFMPSHATLRLDKGSVDIDTEADIPSSGDIHLTVSPREIERFALNVRIPGWSSFREIEINGEASAIQPQSGYARIERSWKTGDRVDVRFDLPLRVVLDSGYGPTQIQTGPVSIDGANPVGARSILIYRGPVILAQFRLQNGCDLVWAYTGDDPYLFETTKTVPDKFVIGRSEFRHESTPKLTRVAKKPEGILIQWEWETGPEAAWVVKRSAWIRATLPVQIEYGAEIIPPPSPDSKDVESALDTGRFCGVRMQWPTTEPSTYFEKRGYPKRPTVSVDNREPVQQAYDGLRGNRIALDSGSVRYQVSSKSRSLIASEDKSGTYSGIYCLPRKKRDGHLLASCLLAITGQSQFQMPLISPHAGVA